MMMMMMIIIIISVHGINPYVERRNASTQSSPRPNFEVNVKLDGTAALQTDPIVGWVCPVAR